MRDFSNIIRTTIITFLLGGLLILWGYKNDGYIRVALGVLVILVFTKNGIDNFNYIKELKLWRTQNNGRLVFFYPAKKNIQLEIEKYVFPLLPRDVLKVYYDGPKLVGDIKRSVIFEIMKQYNDIKVNSPAIFKIVDDKLYREDLYELIDFDITKTDLNILKNKVDKVANA